ncbi:hypothetical protein D3C73_1457520 [compost metagenome]
MIFRNKTPASGIQRIVAVIPHHPEIVHFKGITICFNIVDIDPVGALFEFIVFIDANCALIDW